MQNKHLSFAFSCVTDYFGSLNRNKSISEEETANVNTTTKSACNKKRPSIATGGRKDRGRGANENTKKKEEENN